jgi:predicted secreted Zn-dependent protease
MRKTKALLSVIILLGAGLACNLPSSSTPTPPMTVPEPTTRPPDDQTPFPDVTANQPNPATPTLTPATVTPSPRPVVTEQSSVSSQDTRDGITLITTTNTTRYFIYGATADEIDTEMRTIGPTDPLGGYHWFALTEPLFDWRYDCICGGGGCTVESLRMLLTVNYSFPRWQLTEPADELLRSQWAAFESALIGHEQGHGALAADCAWHLGEAFTGLPPAPTCAELDQAVLAASNPVFAACREAQVQYETETNHGATQGVIWPP